MKILAIDLGRSKSVACDYVGESAEHAFETVVTQPSDIHDLIVRRGADLVVIEICPAAGWIKDLCDAMNQKLLVANTADEPWRWRKVKRKSDRDDALKLGKLAALNQIQAVHVPAKDVRQWRSLIEYRRTLVGEGTSIRNRIRGILDGVAEKLPAGSRAFSASAREQWRKELGRAMGECGKEELWRGIVKIELDRLDELDKHLEQVEARLDEIARGDERVTRLSQAPAVGRRTAEMVVAMVDDPRRFGRGKQVGNYAGLTPKKYQSGQMDRDGRISRGGSGYLRALLVQASWSGIRRKVPWMLEVYERVKRGSEKRKKKAIVAVARRLLVRLWAMLRDGTGWKDKKQVAAMV